MIPNPYLLHMHPFCANHSVGLAIYLAPISVIYETRSFIFFFVLFYTYCKPFLNIRMGTSCQLLVYLHDNNIYWYEMFWVEWIVLGGVDSLVSLIECVPRYPGGRSPSSSCIFLLFIRRTLHGTKHSLHKLSHSFYIMFCNHRD